MVYLVFIALVFVVLFALVWLVTRAKKTATEDPHQMEEPEHPPPPRT